MEDQELNTTDQELNTTDQDSQSGEAESTLKGTQKSKIDSDLLQNIAVTLSLEVGRTTLKIRDILNLSQGSVIELSKLAGEPLDLLVNDTRVAQGEVVLVGEHYGVKLTNVVSASERLKNL
jgi:flagellar motor switch protein FliN/FliY